MMTQPDMMTHEHTLTGDTKWMTTANPTKITHYMCSYIPYNNCDSIPSRPFMERRPTV